MSLFHFLSVPRYRHVTMETVPPFYSLYVPWCRHVTILLFLCALVPSRNHEDVTVTISLFFRAMVPSYNHENRCNILPSLRALLRSVTIKTVPPFHPLFVLWCRLVIMETVQKSHHPTLPQSCRLAIGAPS